jgi:thiol-disulfide isomerase/thioredoxin
MVGLGSHAQTATNFDAVTCDGENFNLFSTLDSGKVVVIGWAMPCGSCILPLQTTYNVVESYQDSFPDRVVMLICDDLANTPCSALDLWAKTYGMQNTLKFSDAAIKMTDYGEVSMPKVVVAAGSIHKVFYVADYGVDQKVLQKAIDSAISMITGIPNELALLNAITVFPNPSENITTIAFTLAQAENLSISVMNTTGKEVITVFSGFLEQGDHQIDFSAGILREGIYLVRLTSGKGSAIQKFSVVR